MKPFFKRKQNTHTQIIFLSTKSQKYYSHSQPNGQDHKIKNQNKNLQAAAEEHGIVDIPLEDTLWLKKMIRSNVEETRFGSRSTN
jgi:hypothetical protein